MWLMIWRMLRGGFWRGEKETRSAETLRAWRKSPALAGTKSIDHQGHQEKRCSVPSIWRANRFWLLRGYGPELRGILRFAQDDGGLRKDVWNSGMVYSV